MPHLFISDLHLEVGRPEIGEQFLAFLDGEAHAADALYILGDLFEAWLGDDDPSRYYQTMKTALRALSDAGTKTFFMHGNRDFMIGDQFAAETGITLLEDPHRLNLFGQRVLLSHGDAYCTDDVEYQKVRAMTRDPEWQALMRSKSIEERMVFAAQARQQSQERGATMDTDIADVSEDAILDAFREHDIDILLHGHTHRPAVHEIALDDRKLQRIVLGDWYTQGSIVRWDENGPRLEILLR